MTENELRIERDKHFKNMEKIQERQNLIMEEARQDICRCTNPYEMDAILLVYVRRFSDCEKYYDEEEKEWRKYYQEHESVTYNLNMESN